jgi:DNA-binding transcriptional LysR family regulator
VAVRNPLDLGQLRVFAAVLDHGGFGRAARALGVAQSTVSEALASLERALGVAVFARSGRRVSLTAAGEALLPHARSLLRAADEAVADVARVTAHVRATVVVGAPESVGAILLPPAVARARRQWPGSRFRIEAALCADIRAAVASGRVDVGLVLEPAEAVDETAAVMAEVPLVVFCAPHHPLARRRATAGELWRYRFVFGEPGGHYHAILRSFFEGAGYAFPQTEVVGSVEAVRRTVLTDGDALGALPAFVIEQDLASGRAAAVTTVPPLSPLELKVLRTAGGARSPIAAALIEALQRGSEAASGASVRSAGGA